MRYPGVQALKTIVKWILVVAIIALIASSLSAWTLVSPSVMQVQSQSDFSTSIFQYVSFSQNITFKDNGGTYVFKFGVDYNKNISQGQPTILDVYAALVSEHLSSAFTHGVDLQLHSANALVDGSEISGIKIRSTYNTNIASFYLTYIRVNSTLGRHTLTARLILNILDINFIGFSVGTTQLVNLNETVLVT